ncbi:Holliday junction branch migration protein RuvA [Sulfurimonas sp. MAG313]|nr:Holliday junction branch migration protein RuvA [Sulfurimonas sp. MAG313]MDF1882287.1 Holliday junction branch migration protein RuvA [Sulfurimonas sp. MAG313]
MIVGINGTIEKKEPTRVYINTNGLVYEVFISINTFHTLDSDKVKLHTIQIIREDAHSLYGFSSESEKQMFAQLIKINGVGPKVALAICSTYTPSSFSAIVQANDVASLKRVPGIGPKGASRILVELSNFIVDTSSDKGTPSQAQAAMALESLGFKKEQIIKVLAGIHATDTGEIVKEALKKLR